MALVTTDPSFCFILQSHICTSGVRGPPSHHSEGGFAAKRRPWGRGEAQCRCPGLPRWPLEAVLSPPHATDKLPWGRPALCGAGPSHESQSYDPVMCQLKCP